MTDMIIVRATARLDAMKRFAATDDLRIQELRDELVALEAEGASPRCDQAVRASNRLARYLEAKVIADAKIAEATEALSTF